MIWFFWISSSITRLRQTMLPLPLQNILVTPVFFFLFLVGKNPDFLVTKNKLCLSYQWKTASESLFLLILHFCVLLLSILNRNQSCDNETENMNDKIKSLVCSKNVSLSPKLLFSPNNKCKQKLIWVKWITSHVWIACIDSFCCWYYFLLSFL